MNKTLKSQLKSAQKEYKEAKIEHDKIKKIYNQCKRNVLDNNKFYVEDPEVDEDILVKDPSSDYRMSEVDFEVYCRLLAIEYEKTTGTKIEYTFDPTWEYRERLIDAENNLFNIAIKYTPAQEQALRRGFNMFKYREEILELMVKLNPVIG